MLGEEVEPYLEHYWRLCLLSSLESLLSQTYLSATAG